MMKRILNIIIPRLDFTGPANLAIEIAEVALLQKWTVNIWYLSEVKISRNDLNKKFTVRKLSIWNIYYIEGIVHTHGFRPDSIGMILGLKKNCKIISTLHGCFPNHLIYEYGPLKAFFLWKIWHFVLKNLDYRICISNSMVEHYLNLKDKCTYDLIYNFRSIFDNNGNVDEITEKWIQNNKNQNKIVFVFIGGLTNRKGILRLVEYIKYSKCFSLLIIGSGYLHSLIYDISKNSSNIHIAGKIINPIKYIVNSDILVLPSLAEGLPLVILEALSVGVPSMLSKIPVHEELEIFGAGLTFDHSTYIDFEDKAFALYKSRNKIEDSRRVKIFNKNFSSLKCASKYIKFYEKII